MSSGIAIPNHPVQVVKGQEMTAEKTQILAARNPGTVCSDARDIRMEDIEESPVQKPSAFVVVMPNKEHPTGHRFFKEIYRCSKVYHTFILSLSKRSWMCTIFLIVRDFRPCSSGLADGRC